MLRISEFGMRALVQGTSFQHLLESTVRKTVRETVQETFQRCLCHTYWSPCNLIEAHVSSRYELHFNFKVSDNLFTNHDIQVEGRREIVIRDAHSKREIRNGLFQSVKVELVVLYSDFGSNENWTKDEFNKNVVPPRKDKGPLLKGEVEIKLINGVANLERICFTDNSSWTRFGKFRLGARVKESSGSDMQRVREARSGSFSVKDQRVEAIRKDRPPASSDEVSRLKCIGPTRFKKLEAVGIKTVQDFVNHLPNNGEWLRNIIGHRMTDKEWEDIVKHAMMCPDNHITCENIAAKKQKSSHKWDEKEASGSSSLPTPGFQAIPTQGSDFNHNIQSSYTDNVFGPEIAMSPLLNQSQTLWNIGCESMEGSS